MKLYYEKEDLIQEIKNLNIKNKKFEDLINFLENDKSLNCYKTNPGNPKLSDIKSITETAFQRAIFNQGLTNLKYNNGTIESIQWIDLELPVNFNKNARRKNVDLIGFLNEDKPVLCELKFKFKTKGINPFYGVFELLIYFYLILKNYENLDNEKVFHECKKDSRFKWLLFKEKKPLLILSANKDYWKDFSNYKEIEQLTNRIYNNYNIEIKLFKTPNESFEIQKNNSLNGKYEPKLNNLNNYFWEELS